ERSDPLVDGGRERAERAEAFGDELALSTGAPLGALVGRPASLVAGGDHLTDIPAEAPLHDLLHHTPEVARGLVMVLARAGHGHATHEMPIDETADLRRHVPLALAELGGDLVE